VHDELPSAIRVRLFRVPQPRRHQVGFAQILLAEQGIYRLRIAAAEDLLDEGARLVDETGRERLGGVKLLLAVQATRATHIFESVIALCQIGRGVPASMLNRALLEEALDVHWVAAHPDIAPAQADEHERLIELGERAMEERFGRSTTPLTGTEEDELRTLRQRHGNFRSPWTLATDAERIALVKERWGEEAASGVDYTYGVIQRQNNALLHPSPIAYGLAMGPGRKQINRAGPDPRWRDALAHGVLGYYLICRVLADEFGFDKEALAGRFHHASCLTKTFTNEELAQFDPEKLCPCGSGRQLSACHAA
jgi:hypothetical protein